MTSDEVKTRKELGRDRASVAMDIENSRTSVAFPVLCKAPELVLLSANASDSTPVIVLRVLRRYCFPGLLDAFSHLYKRVCPSVRPSVHRSVRPSVGHTRVEFLIFRLK